MDDFDVRSLSFSNNEYVCLLTSTITPLIIEGFDSIFKEATNICKSTDEGEKYLMTFQNLIAQIPKWRNTIVEEEKKRIIESSKINYLEDLLSCVHIVQLKAMTNIRVGNKQKKLQIKVPKFTDFIHNCYISSARKLYKNVYLFEKRISALQVQKNNREKEKIIQECILHVIRESIPIEEILRTYLDDTMEEYVEEEIKEEKIEEPLTIEPVVETKENLSSAISENQLIKFNDEDQVRDEHNNEEIKHVPKTIENLEQISNERNEQRKKDEEEDDFEPIQITNDAPPLDIQLDFEDLSTPPPVSVPEFKLNEDDLLVNDIEVLG